VVVVGVNGEVMVESMASLTDEPGDDVELARRTDEDVDTNNVDDDAAVSCDDPGAETAGEPPGPM
jgi:hypothetical protein